jgi:hypothetical protein
MTTETPQLAKLAYTVQNLAVAVDVSESTIRRAIDKGELTASYPTSRPIITRESAQTWLESLPNYYKRGAA